MSEIPNNAWDFTYANFSDTKSQKPGTNNRVATGVKARKAATLPGFFKIECGTSQHSSTSTSCLACLKSNVSAMNSNV